MSSIEVRLLTKGGAREKSGKNGDIRNYFKRSEGNGSHGISEEEKAEERWSAENNIRIHALNIQGMPNDLVNGKKLKELNQIMENKDMVVILESGIS